jgi:predicted regulator of Ras-like GTPase activity (Roadblock/LC7/MglB family)
MSFQVVLRELVERVDGAVSAMIIGLDGMQVEGYGTEDLLNLDDLGAESSAMIKDINFAAQNLGIGNALEFSITFEKCRVLMRRITPEYYFALVMKPFGNLGKGRFMLKTAIPKIEGEF